MSTETDRYFELAMPFIKDAEGGLTDDPADPGGLTNFGIDQRDHPDVDIRNLTWEKAKEIYYKEYWLPSRAYLIPFPTCLCYMDCIVNVGITQTNKLLQRIVKVNDDGHIGPISLKAILNHPNQKELAFSLIEARQNFYENLVERRPSMRVFLKGWTNRNTNLKSYVNQVAACS